MARQKIADYFAQIGIKVDQKSIDRLGKSLDSIERGLHNMEVGAKKSAKQASDLVNQNKNLNKAISDGNKVLNKRAAVTKKIQQANNRVSKASQQAMYDKLFGGGSPTTPKRWSGATAKNAKAWQSNFRESVGRLTGGSSGMTGRARNAQQSMYDQLFGAKQPTYEGLDKSHASAMREDMRRARMAQNIARIQDNVAKREAAMAQRTAAIREAGAKKAAAIITAAELKAQSIASRMGGGGAGRPTGRGLFGGASVGGAVGAASSSMSGLLPGFGAAYAAVNFNKIGQELKSVENALLAVSGSEEAAAENMAFLNSVGAEMGKTVRGLGPEFIKLAASIQGTALGGQEQTIFKSFMKYGTVMGLDEEAMKGSFRAVSQMVSKQQVYAEELRGQLAERLPAAVRIAAEVMTGGDTKALNKMMEAGELDPNELLPKMAAYMDKMAESSGAYSKALGTSIVAQGRMNFQFEKFVGVFSKNGGEQGFAKIFNSISEFMRDNHDVAIGLGEAWNKLGDIFERTFKGIDNLLDGFSMLSTYLGTSEADLAALSATALLLATRFGRIAAAAGVLFLVLEDISVGMKGGDSYTKDLLEFLDENSWVKATAAVGGFALALGAIATAIASIGGAMGRIPGAKGKGGKGLISSIVGTTVSLVRKNPKTAAIVGGLIAYDQVTSAYHKSEDPKIVAEREEIGLRIRNLQRGPGNGMLTEMTNKYPLPGVNMPMGNTTTIDKVEIHVDGSGDPQVVGEVVMKKIQELASMSVKNLPVTE